MTSYIVNITDHCTFRYNGTDFYSLWECFHWIRASGNTKIQSLIKNSIVDIQKARYADSLNSIKRSPDFYYQYELIVNEFYRQNPDKLKEITEKHDLNKMATCTFMDQYLCQSYDFIGTIICKIAEKNSVKKNVSSQDEKEIYEEKVEYEEKAADNDDQMSIQFKTEYDDEQTEETDDNTFEIINKFWKNSIKKTDVVKNETKNLTLKKYGEVLPNKTVNDIYISTDCNTEYKCDIHIPIDKNMGYINDVHAENFLSAIKKILKIKNITILAVPEVIEFIVSILSQDIKYVYKK
jgi:hypothetical protein